MFFETDALKIPVLEACNFIKNRLQHICFSVKFTKSLVHLFLPNTSDGCFWKYFINSFFIVYKNDEWCHCVVRVGYPALISFCCVCCFFFPFFLDFTTCLGIEGTLSILKIKQWSCS